MSNLEPGEKGFDIDEAVDLGGIDASVVDRAALATVVQTWGSAPRRVGAQLVIGGDGRIEGSVSGGCVEGAVVTEALSLLHGEREPGMVTFGYSDDEAFAVGLTCGGTIRLFIEEFNW